MSPSIVIIALFCGFVSGQKKGKIFAVNGYDPGTCDRTNHGVQVLVQDRKKEEKILICAKDNGAYEWKETDGLLSLGEFYNPGYDCSSIVDQVSDASDGFYWINFGRSTPKKVWCDVTTDGGGFMLIGRKKTAITWTVPSNANPVEPHGAAHWSSSLGDASILDFRIQMASSDSFKATKAHWSFRLQSKRPLKKLMTTTDGCDQRSAGIGNIAYVKDLLTDKIVTTNLRCSKFGFGHDPSSKFGWPQMNSCLDKPCPKGFAFFVHNGGHSQLDFYGGFSYRTTGSISGMEYKSTAFIGCDNRHCCGCYGPLGGTKDYCSENCKAINGGTVTNNVFTWFWVRSSLPKKVWKNCMDYKEKRSDGKLISYKLVGHSVVPVEGSCGKNATVLHDGVVVVPDSIALEKAPAVDGLTAYRKDKQELYVRANKRWSALAKGEEVKKELKKMKHEIKILNHTLALMIPEYKECFGYNWLKESNRNKKHHSSSTRLCDSGLSTGWYRFGGEAGIKMPTSCVPRDRCSTYATGWMNGKHPSVRDGKVTRTVCYNWDGNCCNWSNNIEVINCGLYYVYKLKSPPTCQLRYCGSD